MARLKKLATLAATAALAFTGLGFVGAPSASASNASPALAQSCYATNIGDPGNFYIYGEYAGQVEQVWDNCGNVEAHWQWAGQFQNDHPYSTVQVGVWASNGTQFWRPAAVGTGTKDVWFAIGVHATSPDAYEAMAQVDGACDPATGTMHNYGDGSTWWGPHDTPC